MENKLNQLVQSIIDLKEMLDVIGNKVEKIEKRLDGLGKVDSIEHRVTSNQIDITDIKELLERMEETQSAKVEHFLKEVLKDLDEKNAHQFKTIHKRLDSHLVKLGRMEEEMLMIQEDKA
jgi:hypothetical protein